MIKILTAKYNNEHIIDIVFSDGLQKEVDFSFLKNKSSKLFPFDNLNYFKDFKIDEETGTLIWGNEFDISPERIYEYATGIKPKWAID